MRSRPEPMLLAGRYQLGPVLGRGGMGEVRSGRDLRLGRPIAVKVLQGVMAERSDVRRRFEEEARAAARLAHPNVVAVYDTGEHEGLLYIVMERLPGGSLGDEMVGGPLEPGRVRHLAAELLKALEVAHAAGIVHRDIKPANVLFATDGTPKLADFGIAKSAESLDLTDTGLVVGTLAYTAPERLAGQPASPQSDLYSLGVVLYEALTAMKPFSGDSPLALSHAIGHVQPAPLRSALPKLEPALARTVERAMEKDPRRRFATATEMAGRLLGETTLASTRLPPGSATAGAPETAPVPLERTEVDPAVGDRSAEPGSLGIRGPATWRRRGAALGALALLGFVLVLLVIVTVGDGEDRGAQSPPAPTSVGQSPDGTLTEPLARALDRLEESVQP